MKRKRLGFTNRLGVAVLLLVAADLAGGFILACLSIRYQYLGSLACWTVCSTPIGTAATIVLNSIVNKNKAENTNNGKGIIYARAEAASFSDSPEI